MQEVSGVHQKIPSHVQMPLSARQNSRVFGLAETIDADSTEAGGETSQMQDHLSELAPRLEDGELQATQV